MQNNTSQRNIVKIIVPFAVVAIGLLIGLRVYLGISKSFFDYTLYDIVNLVFQISILTPIVFLFSNSLSKHEKQRDFTLELLNELKVLISELKTSFEILKNDKVPHNRITLNIRSILNKIDIIKLIVEENFKDQKVNKAINYIESKHDDINKLITDKEWDRREFSNINSEFYRLTSLIESKIDTTKKLIVFPS